MKKSYIRSNIKKAIGDIPLDPKSFEVELDQYSGKIRESFISPGNPNRRILVLTDRISAFDYILDTIPFKGAILSQTTSWWADHLDQKEIPHHLLWDAHPYVSIVKNTNPVPIEMVVRAYVTGTTKTSSWYAYQHNNREISGITLPEGLEKNDKLPSPIITPTTKAAKGKHDKPLSREEIISQGIVDADLYKRMEDLALKVFSLSQSIANDSGLILVDTKYEMGLDLETKKLMIIDEINTPDSSRYWRIDDYKAAQKEKREPFSLDKEFIRSQLVSSGYDVNNPKQNPAKFMNDELRVEIASRYIDFYEQLTGEPFEIDDDTYNKEEIAWTIGRVC